MADTGTPGKHVIGALKPTESCIALEDLDQYREGIGPPELRKRVQAHLEECSHCRTELTLLEEFAAGNVRPGEEVPVQWIVKRLEDRSARSSVAA